MTPHELAAKHVIPVLRALVAVKLRELGLGQEKIARLLGVSQPLVSRYLREGVEKLFSKLADMGIDAGEAESIASAVASRLLQNGYQDYLEILTAYVNSLLARGRLCEFHRRVSRAVPSTCDICMKLFRPGLDPYLRDVEEAVKLFTSHPKAAKLVPNVGSNIVSAKPNAETIAEVAGLTGAIVRVGDRAAVVGYPAYGGSRHTATVLLMVMRRWRDKRGAIVVSYNEACIERAKAMGLNVVVLGPHGSVDEFYKSLWRAVEKSGKPIDVIADRGGVSLEPVIYIFARSAVEAARIALSCLES